MADRRRTLPELSGDQHGFDSKDTVGRNVGNDLVPQ